MENLFILHIYCFAIVWVLLIFLSMTHAKTIKWKVSKTVGVKFSNAFAEHARLSDISCVDICLATGGCVVANYNPGTRTCALVDGSQISDASVNWHAYAVISGMSSCCFILPLAVSRKKTI